MEKEEQMVEFEIENCRKNIEFYQQEITNMEDKISELEQIRKTFER